MAQIGEARLNPVRRGSAGTVWFEMVIRTFEELRERAKGLGPRRVAVVSADDEVEIGRASCRERVSNCV